MKHTHWGPAQLSHVVGHWGLEPALCFTLNSYQSCESKEVTSLSGFHCPQLLSKNKKQDPLRLARCLAHKILTEVSSIIMNKKTGGSGAGSCRQTKDPNPVSQEKDANLPKGGLSICLLYVREMPNSKSQGGIQDLSPIHSHPRLTKQSVSGPKCRLRTTSEEALKDTARTGTTDIKEKGDR